MWNWIRSLGYSLEDISYNNWCNALAHQEKNALYPLKTLFTDNVPKSSKLKFDCQNTIKGLSGTNIVCPSVDRKLIKIYLSYLKDLGFIK